MKGKLGNRKSFKWRMPISVPRAAVLSLQCVPGKWGGVDNLQGPVAAVSVSYNAMVEVQTNGCSLFLAQFSCSWCYTYLLLLNKQMS